MKFLITILLLVNGHAHAIEFSKDERNTWLKKISDSCQTSFLKYHGRKKTAEAKAACDCAAENLMAVSEREESMQEAESQLKWIDLYYARKHSQSEVDRDPYYLDHYFPAIGEGCLASSEFRLKF